MIDRMQELLKLDPESLLEQRSAKFRKIGAFREGASSNPRVKRNMKPRDAPVEDNDDKPMLLPSQSSRVRQDLELSFSASAKPS